MSPLRVRCILPCTVLFFLSVSATGGFQSTSTYTAPIQSLSTKNTRHHNTKLTSIAGGESSDAPTSTPTPTSTSSFEPFGVGIQRDFTRRLPYYLSDITDGLNAQSLATTLFLFFACLAPAIGFGAILSIPTSGAMGVIEMTISTSLCGVLYALLSAQPIQLIGPMGPNLAFTVSLTQLARIWGVEFLPLYAWTGLWTAGMLLGCAATSASHLVTHLTRFTDEIFSVLISAIFLFEAVKDVALPFAALGTTATKALLTLTCATLTFGSATIFKSLKSSCYFNASIRNNLSNFAPALGVFLGSTAAKLAQSRYGAEVALSSLSLPTKFATTTGRSWLVPLFNLPVWARWCAALPALLATILLYLDQNITARLVNNPRYKMIKGRNTENMMDGMHGDMLVLSFLTGLTSLLGLPWMAGATTRSAAHVRSLLITNEDGSIQGTLENRVSGAAIHAMIGACVLFSAPRTLLSYIPLPVLSGVFLYLGFTSLQGLELWDRTLGLFRDASSEISKSKRWSGLDGKFTTGLTVVQIACVLVMMKITKSSRFGVISPLIIALLPLVRRVLIQSSLIPKPAMEVLDS